MIIILVFCVRLSPRQNCGPASQSGGGQNPSGGAALHLLRRAAGGVDGRAQRGGQGGDEQHALLGQHHQVHSARPRSQVRYRACTDSI